jgi:magnesium-transporting ATPase (P-type)
MFFQHLSDPNHHNHKAIKNFLECLALCHTVVIDEKDGLSSYNASSPDELALVNAAKYLGVTFVEKDDNNNLIIKKDNENEKRNYKLLHVLEFNSTRKRMSVIVQDQEGTIKLICKGADSIIQERLEKTKET